LQTGTRACQIRQKFYDASGIAEISRHGSAFRYVTPLQVSPGMIFRELRFRERKGEMIKNQRIRRTIATIMIVLGAILMILASEIWPGVLLFVAGIVLELAGIAMERKAK
jgi:Zn-dependent membrane protease YugP